MDPYLFEYRYMGLSNVLWSWAGIRVVISQLKKIKGMKRI
ncbi:MAG: hypothetical protein BAJALOKI1v1_20025 [Promethearchaeota archaeon]|nr:MAG: hypothetical protein BAJALOKI1v1_20025 [Candidatus Lokiarchaeota archaeon]